MDRGRSSASASTGSLELQSGICKPKRSCGTSISMLERLRIVTLRCEAVAEIVQHSCVLPLELAHLSLLLLRVKRATCNRNHAAQHSTAKHSTAQHSTAQHSGVHTATGAQHNVRHRIHHARYFFCACRVTSADSRTHIPTRVVRWAVEENLKLAHALQKLRARLQAWPQRVQPELEAIAEYPVVPRSALAFPQTKPQCCAYGVQ